MTHLSQRALAALLVALLAGVSGCAGMSEHERNTAIGAGAGAVGGSILSGGSAIGTLGGAAIGGIIGNEVDGRDRNGHDRR
jgi:osmotically inducible lipoprotein OsmB